MNSSARGRSTSNKIIHQYGHLILFMMRFLAGFRSIILLLLGCANLSTSRFLLIDLASSLVWSILVSMVGYSFANVVYIFVSDTKGYEKIIIPLAVIAAVSADLLLPAPDKRKGRGAIRWKLTRSSAGS